MATQIDERIVSMKFNNAQFEKNVHESMTTLEKLNKKLDFSKSAKSFEEIDRAANKVSLSGLTDAADAVQVKFSTMSLVTMNILNRLVDSAIDAGTRMVKAFSIDQVTSGFSKLEEMTKSTRTIMSATGLGIDEVNKSMEKLNWFTDETSYSLTDMTSNIGKFVANKIPLEDSVTAMQGIAVWAAASGQGINEASRAMYNLSQAMGVGSLKLIDWKSIENANMGTAEFKEAALEAAAAMGKLNKQGERYFTLGKKTEVTVESFRETLNEDWLDKGVLMGVLKEYGQYADLVHRIYEENDGLITTRKIIEQLGDAGMKLGYKAFKAAQEYRTFSDAINATKDAVSSGWMKTFELILGNAEEIVDVWGAIGDTLYDIFAAGGVARNEMLKEWKELGGRDSLLAGLKNIFESLLSVMDVFKEAFQTIFPPMTGQRLYDLTKQFEDFSSRIKLSEGAIETLKTVFEYLLIPVKAVFGVLDVGATYVFAAAQVLFMLTDAFLESLSGGKRFENFLKTVFGNERYARLAKAFSDIIENIGNTFEWVSECINNAFNKDGIEGQITLWDRLKNIFSSFSDAALDGIVLFFEAISNFDLSFLGRLVDGVTGFFSSIEPGKYLLILILVKALRSLFDGFKTVSTVKNIAETIADPLYKFSSVLSSIKWAILGAAILGFALAVASIVETLSSMNTEGLAPKIVALTVIIGEMIGAAVLMDKFAPNVKNSVPFFIEFAAAVGILILSLNSIDMNGILPKLGVLVSIMTLLTAAAVAMNLANSSANSATKSFNFKEGYKSSKSSTKGSSGVLGFAIAVGVIVMALNALDLNGIPAKLGAITAVMVELVAASVITSRFNGDKGNDTIINFAISLGIIVAALNGIELSNILVKVGVITVLMAELVAVSLITSNFKGKKHMDSMLSFALAVGVLVLALNLLKVEGILSKIAIIGGIFAGLAAASVFISKSSKDLPKGASTILAFAAAVGIIAIAFNSLNTDNLLPKLVALSVIMAEMAVVMLAMKNVGSMDLGTAIATAVMMGAILTELVLVFAIMGNFKAEDTLLNAASLTLALTALSILMGVLAATKMNAQKALDGIVGFSIVIGGLGILMAALGLFLSIPLVAQFASKGAMFITFLGALTPTLLALEVVAGAMALIGLPGVGPAIISGSITFGEVVAALTVILTAMGALMSIPGFEDILNKGGVMFAKLGEILGSFLGSIAGGFLNALSNTANLPSIALNLSLFMQAIQPFLTGVEKVDPDKLGGVTDLIGAVSEISQSEINTENIAAFAASMVALGPPLVMFSKTIEGINVDNVKTAAEAMNAFAEFANKIPPKGGKIQEYAGTHDLADFAASMAEFAPNFVDFCKKVQDEDISWDIVEKSITMASSMAELNNNLPASGGTLQDFLGEKNLDSFGKNLVSFGESFKDYYDAITEGNGIDESVITSSANAGMAMTKLASSLEGQGGLLQDIFGEKSLETFGEQLPTFGAALKNYSDAVTGLDTDAVNTSVAAAQGLVDLGKTLDTTGGIGDFFFGTKDLSDFGTKLEDFGVSFKNYSNSVSEANLTAVAEARVSLGLLFQTLNNIGSYQSDALEVIKDGLTSFGTNSMKSFSAAIDDQQEAVKSIGSKFAGWFIQGLNNKKPNAESSSKTIADASKSAITPKESDVIKIGENFVEGFIKGIDNKEPSLGQRIKKLGSDIVERLNDSLGVASPSKLTKETGRYVVEGLANGISDNLSITNKAMVNLGNSSIESIQDALRIHSPSLVAKDEVGVWIVKGIAEGITSDTSAEEAMEKVASNIINAAKNEIAKYDLSREITSLQYSIWELENPNATEEEKKAKALENQRDAVHTTLKDYQTMYVSYQAMLKKYEQGEVSLEKLKEAEKELLTLRKQSLETAKAYVDLQEQTVITQDELDKKSMEAQINDQERAKYIWDHYRKIAEDEAVAEWGKNFYDPDFTYWSNEQVLELAKAEGEYEKIMSNIDSLTNDYADAYWKRQIMSEGNYTLVDEAQSATKILEDASEIMTGSRDWSNPIVVSIEFDDANVSKKVGSGVSKGVKSSAQVVKDTVKEIVDDASKEAAEVSEKGGEEIGEKIPVGGARGIANKIDDFVDENKEMANSAVKVVRDLLEIESPSKVMMKIGEYIVEGLIAGLQNEESSLYQVTAELARGMINTIQSAIRSASQLSDTNAFTITPVLDTSKVETGFRKINAMASQQKAVEVSASEKLKKQTIAAIQNGSPLGAVAAAANYTINQIFDTKKVSYPDAYRAANGAMSLFMKGGKRE